jgi:very-short-patch-repair endonuclease
MGPSRGVAGSPVSISGAAGRVAAADVGTPEARLLRRAADRGGLFTVDDAVAAGFGSRTARRRVHDGAWREVVPSVLTSAVVGDSVELRERAALQWLVEQGAVLSHHSAARRWGIPVPDDPQAWVSVHWRCRPPPVVGVHVHRTRHLDGQNAAQGEHIRLTSPARTVVDLAQFLERAELVEAFSYALQRRSVTVDSVLRTAAVVHHRAGTEQLRAVARELSPEFESYLEVLVGGAFRRRGLRCWIPQYIVRSPGGRFLARSDFADLESRTLLEADGFAYHGSKRQQARDKARDRMLARHGWLTVRLVTEEVLTALEPSLDEVEVIRAVRRAERMAARSS